MRQEILEAVVSKQPINFFMDVWQSRNKRDNLYIQAKQQKGGDSLNKSCMTNHVIKFFNLINF